MLVKKFSQKEKEDLIFYIRYLGDEIEFHPEDSENLEYEKSLMIDLLEKFEEFE